MLTPLQFDIDTPFVLKEFRSQLLDAVGETLSEYSPGEPNFTPFLLKPYLIVVAAGFPVLTAHTRTSIEYESQLVIEEVLVH